MTECSMVGNCALWGGASVAGVVAEGVTPGSAGAVAGAVDASNCRCAGDAGGIGASGAAGRVNNGEGASITEGAEGGASAVGLVDTSKWGISGVRWTGGSTGVVFVGTSRPVSGADNAIAVGPSTPLSARR